MNEKRLVIVDYGMGNLQSVLNRINKIGYSNVRISSEIEDVKNAEKIIIPGVGSFITGIQKLQEINLIAVLNEKVLGKSTPILGICLGMQLFAKWGEEGNVSGLGWLDATCERFKFEPQSNYKIPHMGWNTIKVINQTQLVNNTKEDEEFYFANSYHLVCKDQEDIVAVTEYGYDFPSVIQHKNIVGCQFHPEKSHQSGLTILSSFLFEY